MSCFTIWSRETERMLCFASLRNLSALAAFTPVIPKLSPKISKYALLRCALCCPGDTFVCGKSHLECTCIRARSFECCVCVCVCRVDDSMGRYNTDILVYNARIATYLADQTIQCFLFLFGKEKKNLSLERSVLICHLSK